MLSHLLILYVPTRNKPASQTLSTACLELFRERLSGKIVHATIPNGNMGYDQYTVPDLIVAVESSVVAFLKQSQT